MLDLGRVPEGRVGQEQKSTMPPKRSTPKTLRRASELRKQTTPAEKKLWGYLRIMRKDGIHFRRQYAIGPYITDFCAPRRKLILELDGSQHFEQEEYDEERTKYLESQGYQVIRFWNNQVLGDIESVIKSILYGLESNKNPHRTDGDP